MIIWLASYPRSGNTFFRVYLRNVFGQNTYSLYDDNFDIGADSTFSDVVGHERLPQNWSPAKARADDKIWFVKTHDPPISGSDKAIYLVRDGREVVVSYLKYLTHIVSLDTDILSVISGAVPFGSWSEHLAVWSPQLRPNTLLLHFEDFVANPYSYAERISTFVGLTPIQSELPDFSTLKEMNPIFFSKGEIDSWKSRLSPSEQEAFNLLHGEALRQFGYELKGLKSGPKISRLVNDFQAALKHHWRFTLEKEQAIQDLAGRATEIENELLIKEGVIHDVESQLREAEGKLLIKEGVIHDVVSQLREAEGKLTSREEAYKQIEGELIAKEKVISSFKTSLRYWLRYGPFRRFYPLTWIGDKAASVRRRFQPKLGTLFQHPPKPLEIPPRYSRKFTGKTKLPDISIVTPSYNQAQFLGRTITSVLEQGYPALEYVVQDGGSDDGTTEILAEFAARLTHAESRKDDGQAQAINLGFAHTTGEIMAYLNSDDMLLPGSLHYVGNFFARHPHVDVVYGHRVIIDEQDQEVGRWVLPPHNEIVTQFADFVPQETLFWRRSIWEKAGGEMDESFHFALDWDLLIRFQEAGATIVRLPRFLGAFRVHEHQKTLKQIDDRGSHEMDIIRKRIHGREITFMEINRELKVYLRKSVVLHKLYRLNLIPF